MLLTIVLLCTATTVSCSAPPTRSPVSTPTLISPPTQQTPTSSTAQRLRIVNAGQHDITNLIVWFPDEQINFGDVPAGSTTPYVEVPSGVYHYSAYQFDLDGEQVTQPVIDFVGEVPMQGQDFTYTLDFDPARPRMTWIKLLDVKRDQ